MKPINISVILGSESDLEAVKASKMLEIFEAVGVHYDVSIISAHRNRLGLETYCLDSIKAGVKVFIGVAGMSAALPGDIAAIIKEYSEYASRALVIGVPLPSTGFPDAQDALLSIIRMPSGVPVAVCGIGKSGLENSAIYACQIVALNVDDVADNLEGYLFTNTKSAQLHVITSKEEDNGTHS